MATSRALTSFSLLSFDCYGTLVDWEGGIVDALEPLTTHLDESNELKHNSTALLQRYCFHEGQTQAKYPTLKYSAILEHVFDQLALEFGLKDVVTERERSTFGASIGRWPAFPDTIAALKTLARRYKLVILSNVDRESFGRTLQGPLAGISFHAVYVAEDIGSYKPDLRNFGYLMEHCEKDLQISKDSILHTAYALNHDLVPATKAGLACCWIERMPNAMGGDLKLVESQLNLNFRFGTLDQMAEAAEAAFR